MTLDWTAVEFLHLPLNHCSECIIRWWNWLQMKKEVADSNTSSSVRSLEDMEDQQGVLRCNEVFVFSFHVI